jgi:hypothetical protein
MRMAADIMKSKNFECESNLKEESYQKRFEYEINNENKYSNVSGKRNIDVDNIFDDSR